MRIRHSPAAVSGYDGNRSRFGIAPLGLTREGVAEGPKPQSQKTGRMPREMFADNAIDAFAGRVGVRRLAILRERANEM